MELCKLCGRKSKLQNSHMIPKFVMNWLKETSATGLLRKAINPQIPVQDGLKKRILCLECEGKFSKYENIFSKKIFFPYHKVSDISFEIDEPIHFFAISLAWRLGMDSLEGFKQFQPEMYPHLKEAVEHWQRCLNTEETDKKYEHHIFFADLVEDPGTAPREFDSYMLRAVDGTIGASPEEVFCFVKLPGIFLVSLVHPSTNNQSINTKMIIGKKIEGSQSYAHAGFHDFLLHRVKEAYKHKLSKRQIDKITERMLKNKERTLNSESFRVRHRLSK